KLRAIVRAHLSPMCAQPLLQLHAHLGLDRRGGCSQLDTAHQRKPVCIILVQIAVTLHDRLGIERQKEIGRSSPQRRAKEAWRCDSNYSKWLVIEVEDAADD